MRTSINIMLICCLCSCKLFKNSTTVKRSSENHSKETMLAQQLTQEQRKTLVVQAFASNDSTETMSMIEIVPKGQVSFTEAAGIKTEASLVRIFTKSKTGKTVSRTHLKQDSLSRGTQTNIHLAKDEKVSVAEKSAQHKLPFSNMMIVIIFFAALLVVVWRYFRKWLP